jgi:hypothetical protein
MDIHFECGFAEAIPLVPFGLLIASLKLAQHWECQKWTLANEDS